MGVRQSRHERKPREGESKNFPRLNGSVARKSESNRAAENLGVKNAKWDKEDGYRVPRDCYNSYFFPVEDPKISIVDKFQMHGGEVVKLLDGRDNCHYSFYLLSQG